MTRSLSHSSLQDFLACPRRFQWRKVCRLKKERKATALRVGNRYHEGLDRLKRAEPLESVLAGIWESFREVPPWVKDVEAWHCEREVCLRLLCGWQYFTAPLEAIASEIPFEARIRNPDTGRSTGRFRLRGVIDGIVRLPDGRVAVLEHKTTSQPIEGHSDYIRRLRVDSQISRYVLAAREVGIPASAVVYDITRKPTLRPRRLTQRQVAQLRAEGTYFDQPIDPIPAELDRETPEMFGARLNDAIAREPERYFRRLEVPRLSQDLLDEARELWQQQQAIARALKTGHFYRNTSACLSPYRCEYAELCLSGISPASLAPGEVPDGYFSTSTTRKETSS